MLVESGFCDSNRGKKLFTFQHETIHQSCRHSAIQVVLALRGDKFIKPSVCASSPTADQRGCSQPMHNRKISGLSPIWSIGHRLHFLRCLPAEPFADFQPSFRWHRRDAYDTFRSVSGSRTSPSPRYHRRPACVPIPGKENTFSA
jgi:hypothetical protein